MLRFRGPSSPVTVQRELGIVWSTRYVLFGYSGLQHSPSRVLPDPSSGHAERPGQPAWLLVA